MTREDRRVSAARTIAQVAPQSPADRAASSRARTVTARCVVVALAGLAIVSLVTVAVAFPAGVAMSSDPGAPAVPLWVVVMPPVVGIVLALLLPPSRHRLPAVAVRPDRLRWTTWLLLAAWAAFTAAALFLPLGGEDYVLAKVVVLVVVPALVVALLRSAVRIGRLPAGRRRRGAWRWWAPVLVIGVWALLSQAAPWVPPADLGSYDTATLVVAGTATALSAGVGEELFYRRWLQTRLEAAWGAGAGVAVTSVLFALMHLGSHGEGPWWLDVARVVVVQGAFGVFMGVLWWRYRNLAAVIAAHVIANGWLVVAELITR